MHLNYQGRTLEVGAAESVLNGLLRDQIQMTFGCRQGNCHACMLQAVEGPVSSRSQEGLRDTLRSEGYFLACRCYPTADLTLVKKAATTHTVAPVVAVEALSDSVVRVRLRPQQQFPHHVPHHAGQCVILQEEPYALASLAREDTLDIHARAPGWALGTAFDLEGPLGDSYYVPGNQQDALLLAGQGRGLAALYGIARDALERGHGGPIWLLHGPDFYLSDELRALENGHPQFHFVAVEDDVAGEVRVRFADLRGWRVYLAGNAGLVQALRRACFQAGAEMATIHADVLLDGKRPPAAAG